MDEILNEEFYKKVCRTCAIAVNNVAKRVIPDSEPSTPSPSKENQIVCSNSDLNQKKCLAKEALALLNTVCNMKQSDKAELNVLNDVYEKTLYKSSKEETFMLQAEYEFLIINACEMLSRLLDKKGHCEILPFERELSMKELSSVTEQEESTNKIHEVLTSKCPQLDFREYPSIESFLYSDEGKFRKSSLELKRGLKQTPIRQCAESSNASESHIHDSYPEFPFMRETENLSVHYFEVPYNKFTSRSDSSSRILLPKEEERLTCDRNSTKVDECIKTAEVQCDLSTKSSRNWEEVHSKELSDLVNCLVQTVAYIKGKSNVKPSLPERDEVEQTSSVNSLSESSGVSIEVADQGTSPLQEESDKELTDTPAASSAKPKERQIILRNSASQTVEPGEPIVAPKVYTFFLREGDSTFHSKLPMSPPVRPKQPPVRQSLPVRKGQYRDNKAVIPTEQKPPTDEAPADQEEIDVKTAFYGLGIDLASHNSEESVDDSTDEESDKTESLSGEASENRGEVDRSTSKAHRPLAKKVIQCKVDSGIRLKAKHKKHTEVLVKNVLKPVHIGISESVLNSQRGKDIKHPKVKSILKPERSEWEKLMQSIQSPSRPRLKPILRVEKAEKRNASGITWPSKQKSKSLKREKQLITEADKLLSKIINEDLLKVYEERRQEELLSECPDRKQEEKKLHSGCFDHLS